MPKKRSQRLVQSCIAFAAAVVVWLVFYFWFPSTPLTTVEFLVVFVIAYLVVAAVNRLISRQHGKRAAEHGDRGAGPGAAHEQDGT